MDYSRLIISFLVVLMNTNTVTGQGLFTVTCNADLDKTVQFVAILNDPKFAYILDCGSTQGENNGAGFSGSFAPAFFTIDDCNLQWDVTYLAVMTANQGYMLYSDLSQLRAFTCVRVTGTHTANIGVTVDPGTATATAKFNIDPPIMSKFTDQSSDRTGAAILSANMDDPLRLHIWIDTIYTGTANGLDIRVKTITATSGGVTITLTGDDGSAGTADGCQAHPAWGEVDEVPGTDGYLRVDFSAFMIGAATTLNIVFEAVVEKCAGLSCPAYPCSSGSAMQYGRRRRDLTNITEVEEVKVKGYLQILPYKGYIAPDRHDDSMTKALTTDVTSCEPCAAHTPIYAVMGVLVATILLSLVMSLFLFRRFKRFTSVREMSGTHSGIYT